MSYVQWCPKLFVWGSSSQWPFWHLENRRVPVLSWSLFKMNIYYLQRWRRRPRRIELNGREKHICLFQNGTKKVTEMMNKFMHYMAHFTCHTLMPFKSMCHPSRLTCCVPRLRYCGMPGKTRLGHIIDGIRIFFNDICRRLKCNPSLLTTCLTVCIFQEFRVNGQVFTSRGCSFVVDEMYRPNSDNSRGRNGGLLILWCLFPSKSSCTGWMFNKYLCSWKGRPFAFFYFSANPFYSSKFGVDPSVCDYPNPKYTFHVLQFT